MKYSFQFLIFIGLILFSGCNSYEPTDYLNKDEIDERLISISYYTETKPKEVSYKERFSDIYRPYYKRISENLHSKFEAYFIKDSLHYFLISKDEPKSLYEDKRAVGGVYKLKGDSISQMDIKFITPMGKKDETLKKSQILFDAMVQDNLGKYSGDPTYMEWPNQDVVYDIHTNRWVFPEGSRYKAFENVMTNQK